MVSIVCSRFSGQISVGGIIMLRNTDRDNPEDLLEPLTGTYMFVLYKLPRIMKYVCVSNSCVYIWLHVTAGMRGCTGAAKEMICGAFFLVRFKIVGVKLEDGLDIKISVKTRSRD